MPTGTPAALARMASTAARWARTNTSLTWRRASRSRLPGGKAPPRYPMVDTMLGSLIVQARLHQAVEAGGRLLAEGGEAVGHVVALPAALVGQPERAW